MSKLKHPALLALLTIISSLAINACGAQSASPPTATEQGNIAPTPTPTLQGTEPTQPASSPLTPTQLKYLLLDKYANAHNLLYCDPDSFPISVSPEQEKQRAETKLPELQSDTEHYQAILQHNNITSTTDLTDDQKLLIYREYKKLNAIKLEPADGKYKFTIQVGKVPDATEGDGTKIEGEIDQSGAITNETRQDVQVQCPICLAGNTQIDTPNGPVAVKDLRKGMPVWTLDSYGTRRASTIQKTVKRSVPSPHEMVHIVLNDGRELFASPGHPTMDGQPIGVLNTCDSLDNALIVKAERIPSGEDATYDILPSSETGFYWANGILVASTLAPPARTGETCLRGHLKDQP